LVHLLDVNLAELFDVKRPAILIRLVVVLWVVFEDLRLFFVVECRYQLVDADAREAFPPVFAVDEPISRKSAPTSQTVRIPQTRCGQRNVGGKVA